MYRRVAIRCCFGTAGAIVLAVVFWPMSTRTGEEGRRFGFSPEMSEPASALVAPRELPEEDPGASTLPEPLPEADPVSGTEEPEQETAEDVRRGEELEEFRLARDSVVADWHRSLLEEIGAARSSRRATSELRAMFQFVYEPRFSSADLQVFSVASIVELHEEGATESGADSPLASWRGATIDIPGSPGVIDAGTAVFTETVTILGPSRG